MKGTFGDRVIETLCLLTLLFLALYLRERHEVKVTTKKVEKEVSVNTQNEVCYISSIINAECNTCSTEEKFLIGSVVMNRAKQREMTILEILQEENQFEGLESDMFYPTTEGDSIARNLLQDKGRNHKFLYFYTGEPCWSVKLVNVKRESWHHTFSY